MAIILTDIENEDPIVTPQEQKKLLEFDEETEDNSGIIDDIRNAKFDIYNDFNFVSGSTGTTGTSATSGSYGTSGESGGSGTSSDLKKQDAKAKKTDQPKGAEEKKPDPPSKQLTAKTLAEIEKIQLTPQQKTLIEKARSIPQLPDYFKQSLPLVVTDPYNINTPGRLAHFCGQIMTECGFNSRTEGVGYRSERLRQAVKGYTDAKGKYHKPYWPGRLTDQEIVSLSIDKGSIKPSQIGGWPDVVYGSRKEKSRGGNKFGTLDGYNYRGHGLIQITFKSPIYQLLIDLYPNEGFDKDTEKISTDPKWALISALAWWLRNKATVLRDDVSDSTITNISTRVNGTNPANHLDLRIKWTKTFYDKLK